MKKYILSLIALALSLSAFCGTPQRPGVIFDTDQGNDIDDALALDVLYKMADLGKLDILGITLSKSGLGGVEFVDLMNRFYGYGRVPVGKITDGAFDPEDHSVNYAEVVASMKDDRGRPLFKRSESRCRRAEEGYLLMRKLLAGAEDNSVTIVSVGFFTNLKRLLESQPDRYSEMDGRELVKRKVNLLVTVAGVMNDTSLHEYNVVNDIPAARMILEDWPGEVVISPWELGIHIQYPGERIESDLSWARPHPLVEAYKCYLPMPYTRSMWDDTAVLFAAGETGMFTISPYGDVEVTDEGSTIFRENPLGTRRHISVTPEQADALLHYLTGTIARKPYKNSRP